MTINERFKRVRKALKLTQTEFGEAIGLKQSAVGNIEQGRNAVTDRTISLLCKSYNVDETWLRDGGDDDDMFSNYAEASIISFANEYNLDSLSQTILSTYVGMHHKKREAVNLFLREISLEVMRKDIENAETGVRDMINNISTLQREKSEQTKSILSDQTTILFSELLNSRYFDGGMADEYIPPKQEKSSIDEEVENYRRELEEEEKVKAKSLVLDGIKEA